MDNEALSNEYLVRGIRREKSLIFERAQGFMAAYLSAMSHDFV